MARKRYKFLVACDYDLNSRHYKVGEVDSLKDWQADHIAYILQSKIAEVVEKPPSVSEEGGENEWQAE